MIVVTFSVFCERKVKDQAPGMSYHINLFSTSVYVKSPFYSSHHGHWCIALLVGHFGRASSFEHSICALAVFRASFSLEENLPPA